MKTPALERARTGAKLLDQKLPGWRDNVDREKLDMSIGVMRIPARPNEGRPQ